MLINKDMEKVHRVVFWSNLFFLIPFFFAVTNKIWLYSVIIGIVFIVSSIFHFNYEKKFKYLDIVSSTILIISNMFLLFLGHWILPYSAIAIGLAVIAIFFYLHQNKKTINHVWWHIFSAAVSFFCIATYLHL